MSETDSPRRHEAPSAGENGGAPSPAGNGAGDAGGATDTTRRDFLKILGVSGAGAAATACTPPETTDKLLPRLVHEEDVEPGENTVYSTVLARGGPEPAALRAWVRDGRTINLETNPDFPGDGEGVSALARSALQDLYDPDRFRGPRRRSGGELAEASWDEAVAAAAEAIGGDGDAVLLTGPTSGTRERFLSAWAAEAGVEHVGWEPLHHEVEREAQRLVFGRAEIPDYALDRADRIVSFGADFLGTWLAPGELSARFARAREIDEGRYAELTYVGPRVSLTGTSADGWIQARSGTEGLVALAVARLVAEARGGPEARRVRELLVPYAPDRVAERSGVSAGRIRSLAEDLAAAERPVALPPGAEGRGPAATEAHAAVALLNYVAGAVGETVRFGAGPLRGRPSTLETLSGLVERMRTGEVTTLLVADANPAYALPDAADFEEALEDVTLISLDAHPTETASAADWVLPTHHELESWGDAEVRPGVWALAQPTMTPVFDTRGLEDALMLVAEAAGTDLAAAFGAEEWSAYLQEAWREKHASVGASGPFERWWDEALQRGGWWEAAPAPSEEVPELSDELGGVDFSFDGDGGDGFDLVVFPTPQLYDGRGANRGWMQELPDPVSKVVWNSWVEMHPETAEPMGLEDGDVVELRSEAGVVRAAVKLYRGVRPDTVAVPMGQGHEAYGRHAEGRGVNPLDLLAADADGRTGALALAGTTVRVTATGERERLVDAQGSDTDHGRDVAKLLGLEEARERVEAHEVDLAEMVEAAWDSDPESPYRWGMTIDLNACTGCGACVTACYAENNLPVVGEEKFDQGREMSWLRIERYFEETADGGFQTTHEPMLCQHCGDAPCEPVCPVYATYHNPEGLNVQVYNRCVGTRYCSNNCPYKVRRFNWFSYDFPYPLDMQLNPDVTVRDKGVMEKCTFCVQRINRAKVRAKEKGRLVRDGEVTTACQGACPTDAIVFGNLKDPTSEVSKVAKGARSYHVLEELHTRPAVTYLEDVTAADLPEEAGHGHGGGHGEGGEHGGGDGHGGASENGGPADGHGSGGGGDHGEESGGGAPDGEHAPARG